ncbi:MAG: carbon-nitrogen hydrolase family protein [Psychrobium sp.]
MSNPKLISVQLVSSPNIEENLNAIETQLIEIRQQFPSDELLVVLPECCLMFATKDHEVREFSEHSRQGPMQNALSDLSQRFNLYLVAGTIAIKADDGRHFAASILFNPQGEQLGQYNKIHLFDVDVTDGYGSYRESENTHPGQHISVIKTPIGNIGMAVCYDLRFGALFQTMREMGADIFVLPSAFTKVTGQAHWELLSRARAVENQCYMIASNQGGEHKNGRVTWGQSMVVDPWGVVESEIASGEGFAVGEFDRDKLQALRTKMPMASQQRFQSTLLKN